MGEEDPCLIKLTIYIYISPSTREVSNIQYQD